MSMIFIWVIHKNMTNLVSMSDAIQAFEGQPKDLILKLGYGVIAGNLAYFFSLKSTLAIVSLFA